ncbi:MAG TPA: phosphoadenylyl-sulfate reductase [Acidimicrobiales bacterium]|nr:phosphoadenylyl-sulfate reductase [Acidimicrobiales bacterium]
MTLLDAPSTEDLTDDVLADLNAKFERSSAGDIVEWAVERFYPHLCLTASMTDAVLIDVATRVEPAIEVVFIDTGYHFPETLETLEEVRRRYGLNLRIMTVPRHPVPLWKSDPVNCCTPAKLAQLERALVGKKAWMSGLRREESESRRGAPIVTRDRRGLVKLNPLANWADLDVQGYIADHDVPVNPLLRKGYPSIGCWPCTRPVVAGEHSRAGRWAGLEKTECGLHDEVIAK